MFEVENADIVYESPSSQFATAKIQAFATGTSLHNTTCDIETLKRTAPTIFEKPIIFEYDNRLRDFGSHSDKPIISGFVVPNSAEYTELPDGRIGLNIFAKIWKRYAPKFIDVFKETGTNKKSVSVEMQINDAEETPDGLLKLLDFVFESICVLGDYVTPASPDANIQMLSFAKEENDAYKEAYQKEFAMKYDALDFSIPEEVKSNCKKGLDMCKEMSSGGTSVSLAYARYIVKNTHSTPDRVRQAHKYFSGKHDNETEVSYNLWGGSSGKDWVVYMNTQMEDIDGQMVSYFDLYGLNKPDKEEGFTEEESKPENNSEMEENKDMAKTKEEMAAEEAEKKKAEQMAVEEEKKAHDDMMAAEEEKKKAEEMAADESKKKDDEEEDKKNKVSMSLNENLDVAALLEILKRETESYRELAGGLNDKINYSINAAMGEIAKGAEAKAKVVTDAMISYMDSTSKKLSEFAKANELYMEENKSLKEFKDKVEAERKNYEVSSVLKEASEAGMPDAELEACRAEAAEFSLENIDSYKNMVKAKAFKYFGKKTDVNSNITKIGMPFNIPQYKAPSVWE